MSTDVDICNLALANLGDVATVASISPPEGSAQADHCARFYPIARDSLLEMHPWNFSTRRIALAQLTSAWSEWDYAYAKPSNALKVWAVLPPDVSDDYSAPALPTTVAPPGTVNWSIYTPQPFVVEVDADGNDIIYTDQESAVLRYSTTVTDTSKFSHLFVVTLSWHLASMLAGPVIKGSAGAAESKRAAGMMTSFLSMATTSDSNQQHLDIKHNVPWMAVR